MNALYFSGGASLSNKQLRGLGSILMLHRIGEPPKSPFSPNKHLSVSDTFLESSIKKISQSIYEFVSLDEAANRLRDKNAGSKKIRPFVSLTLDDGYRDNLKNAVPIFRKYNVPFTIYIAPGLVDGRATLWWEDLEAIVAKRERIDIDLPGGRTEMDLTTPKQKNEAFDFLLNYLTNEVSESEQRRLMTELCWLYKIDAEAHRANSIMNWDELIELSKDPLCTLGAHTIGHYAVARLSEKDARYELQESRNLVEVEIGKKVEHFAYPYGYPAAAGTRDFGIASDCGFSTAVTTRHGVCCSEHQNHMTALPRISVNGNFQKQRYLDVMLSGATTRLSNKGGKINVG